MKMQSVQGVTKEIIKSVNKKSPTILTGLAVAGLITTTVMAVKATPKAIELINQERDRRFEELPSGEYQREELLTKKEIIKVTWRCYLPAIVMGGATVACIVGANNINMKRNAALASIYSITETTLKEYQAKVKETIGENKEREIKKQIIADHMEQHPNREVIITGNGETLCYDVYSGRYFKSDKEEIRRIENDLNAMLINGEFVSLNDLYYELGMDPVKFGNEFGWNIENGQISFDIDAHLSPDGVPCLSLDYHVDPRYIN